MFPPEASLLSPSDVTAVVFLCKHMKTLNSLDVGCLPSLDCFLEIIKLLQGRCMESLTLFDCHLGDVGLERLGVLLKSECQVNHENSNLAALNHECCNLTSLSLPKNNITAAGMASFSDHQVYNQFTILHLEENPIGDEGARNLSTAMKERQLKLYSLNIAHCSLTSHSIPWLVKFLGSEHCGLRCLKLERNAIKNEVYVTCAVFLGRKHVIFGWMLVWLDVTRNGFTDKHLSLLADTLKFRNCCLICLRIMENCITDEGSRLLKKTSGSHIIIFG